MKTMGISRLTSANCFCRSSPLKPGSCKSNTKQLGASAWGRARNCCAEANASTLNPAERIRLSRDSRTDGSSSTTAISASDGFNGWALVILRNGKMKGRARSVIGGRPQPASVVLHDRPANGESQAQARRFRGVEGCKDPIHVLRLQTKP